jgi:3-oxoacyl-[acyl-carrier protein] reductase
MPYSLSKTSLLRFVENFAAENLNENIRINAVAPGVMPSRMQEEVLHSRGMEKSQDYLVAANSLVDENLEYTKLLELCDFLISHKSQGITGKLINSNWDNWPEWPNHLIELESSDLYTLRRITSRDRGKEWGDL